MSNILCLALNPAIDISCDADRVQPTLKVRTRNQRHDPGGGGTNVAHVLATFGVTPDLGYLCGGATGALFDSLLEGLNLRRHRFEMSGSVRLAYMVHEEQTGFEYRFVPEGPAVTEAEIAKVLEFATGFDCSYFVASGSLPRGASVDTYAKLAAASAERNIRFVLDTSGEPLRAALGAAPVFLIKPSLRELETLTGQQLDEEEALSAAASIVKSGGARNVVVSMGREGALLVNEDLRLRAPSFHVKTASAVGAGDSFLGAMVWRLSIGRPIEEAFRFGIAAGAAAAMTPGTELCRAADVFALFEGTKS